MKKTTPETEPRLFKAEGKASAVLTGDPSVTIIEAHDALGFLLSESCYYSMDGANLHLENVIWIRQPYKKGTRIFRPFPEVILYRHHTDGFVAEETEAKNYLPWPSEESYAVIFINKRRYDEIHKQVQKEATDQLFNSLKPVVRKIRGFSLRRNALRAPSNYARKTSRRLERPILEP